MNILLLGSGGREHAFAWKIAQSKRCTKLYIAPGNAGTMQCGENVNLPISDFEAIGKFCLAHDITMVIPASEQPLVDGIYDYFIQSNDLKQIPVIGPSRAGAQLEGSKAYAKQFMERNGIPTANYREFTKATYDEGVNYLKQHAMPVVLKADGLAAGKGVLICKTVDEALSGFNEMIQAEKFGTAGHTVVVESFLDGIELSVFVLTDGKNYCLLPTAKDYKRIGEGDTGLNTGGMGAVSPVPFASSALMEKVELKIIQPTISGLKKEGIEYKGFIYFGLIKVGDEPIVIEYNCRMGDPETEAVLPRITNDLVELFEAVKAERLGQTSIVIDKRAAVTIVLASGGYPEEFEKNKVIEGLFLNKESIIFHAGTKKEGETYLTNGGRVLMVTSLAANLEEALRISNESAKRINYDKKYYRSDIGRDLGLSK